MGELLRRAGVEDPVGVIDTDRLENVFFPKTGFVQPATDAGEAIIEAVETFRRGDRHDAYDRLLKIHDTYGTNALFSAVGLYMGLLEVASLEGGIDADEFIASVRATLASRRVQ